MKNVKRLMTSIAMTMFIALSFSANAQTDRVTVTNNTACDMTVAILGSSQTCFNDDAQGTALVPAGSTMVVFFYDMKNNLVTTDFTGAGAMETDALGIAQGNGASQDTCTSTNVTGTGPSCGSFNVTITGQATMSIN